MAPNKIRKALGAVKDRTSISLAKVGSSPSLSDLDVAIVKATRHEEYPAEERHIREILSLTCYSSAYVSASVNTLSKRLNKTRNWIVALKILMLIQRLLSEGDPAYEHEIFFSTRRGTRMLNLSDFRDKSQSNPWDYSAFVRTYALYLDERLEFRMQSRRGKRSVYRLEKEEEEQTAEGGNSLAVVLRPPPVHEMKTEQIFSRTQHLQQILDRFLACRPTGAAKANRVVIVALYPILKESFQLYYDLTETMGILIDRFKQLDVQECVKVYEIFCRVAKQFDELNIFYGWCKSIGIARSSEYPELEKITVNKLAAMDEFIRDKSGLCNKNPAQKTHHPKEAAPAEEGEKEEEDVNKVTALPAPVCFSDALVDAPAEGEKTKTDDEEDTKVIPQVDLLDLREDDDVASADQADKLALALFDGGGAAPPASQSTWQAFNEDTADWEKALIESASCLSNQTTNLAGGFDMLLLDGMYNTQPPLSTSSMASSAARSSGSGSSMAAGFSGGAAVLALPAAPTAVNGDPFGASGQVAAPAYVQMAEMERKQKMLVEEQRMWEQYGRSGTQGQNGQLHSPYNMG